MDFTYMKDFMKRFVEMGVPGNTIRVWQNHREIFSHTEGYADVENKVKMTGDELFNIYSCSKVATVTAALQLYEKGAFLLDTPLYDFIPEYREMYIKDKDGNIAKAKNAITMRHLFTMTAGFSYDRETDAFKLAYDKTNGQMNTVETMRCLAKDPLGFEPGTKWRYSLCHDVLGAVVEVISGKRFSTYVTENIFKPLGMNESYYKYTDKLGERMASQYRFVEEKEEYRNIADFQARGNSTVGHIIKLDKINTMDVGPEFESGGGGVISSANDYIKLADALSNGGVGATGEKILSKGTIELMRTNQLGDEQIKCMTWSQLKGCGYGLGVRCVVDRAKSGFTGPYSEFGWGGAAGSTIMCDPDTGISMFYAMHMLNPMEHYYQPRIKNLVYTCMDR